MTGLAAGAMLRIAGDTDCHVAALLAMTGLGAGCLWAGLPGRFAVARRGRAPALRVRGQGRVRWDGAADQIAAARLMS